MVQIREGTPFTVPPGKVFVLTALGYADEMFCLPVSYATTWTVDGVVELTTGAPAFDGGPSMARIPRGYSYVSGRVLEVEENLCPGGVGRAWGFLADSN